MSWIHFSLFFLFHYAFAREYYFVYVYVHCACWLLTFRTKNEKKEKKKLKIHFLALEELFELMESTFSFFLNYKIIILFDGTNIKHWDHATAVPPQVLWIAGSGEKVWLPFDGKYSRPKSTVLINWLMKYALLRIFRSFSFLYSNPFHLSSSQTIIRWYAIIRCIIMSPFILQCNEH